VLTVEPSLTDCPSLDVPALLAQAQQGDPEAFDILCRELESRLLRQAILLCGNVSLAEDLAQETLVEAWKCLDHYRGGCQFFTWLCAILHNRYRNVLRDKRLLLLLGLRGADRNEAAELLEQQPDDHARPDEAVQSREQAALVRTCVHALPAKQQQVIYLRFFVDDSLDGIAAALRCSVGTVKSRLFHALDKLRRMPAMRRPAEELSRKVDIL
jgi:RNA polymerase sigma-70 factor (ECF subfamily)